MSTPLRIRPAAAADLDAVARMLRALWSDATMKEHRAEAALILAGTPPSTPPLVIFLAEADGKVAGSIEVGFRSHADGCDGRKSVAFIEGWFVEPEHRSKKASVEHSCWERRLGRVRKGAARWFPTLTSTTLLPSARTRRWTSRWWTAACTFRKGARPGEARSCVLELDVIKKQFGTLLPSDLLEQVMRDLRDLEKAAAGSTRDDA